MYKIIPISAKIDAISWNNGYDQIQIAYTKGNLKAKSHAIRDFWHTYNQLRIVNRDSFRHQDYQYIEKGRFKPF